MIHLEQRDETKVETIETGSIKYEVMQHWVDRFDTNTNDNDEKK